MDLALNNPQRLVCHKTPKCKQTKKSLLARDVKDIFKDIINYDIPFGYTMFNVSSSGAKCCEIVGIYRRFYIKLPVAATTGNHDEANKC